LPKIVRTIFIKMFRERIKELREERQLPLRKLAAALDIDSATYWKIEKGNRRARKEHIPIIASILNTDEKELLTFWLADQITAVVADEKESRTMYCFMVKQNLNNSKKKPYESK